MDVLNTLREALYELLERDEGITKADLSLVDLDIEYSPVIPIKGGSPMKVDKLQGGVYEIRDAPMFGTNIPAETITIMRYRYLISRDKIRI